MPAGASAEISAEVSAEVLADPGDRGRLVVADRVFERLAARAATEVPGTVELSRRGSSRLPGRGAVPARAEATVSGRLVQLRVTVGIDYPRSVREVTRAVREHVRARVEALGAVEVRDVDVVVGALRPAAATKRVR